MLATTRTAALSPQPRPGSLSAVTRSRCRYSGNSVAARRPDRIPACRAIDWALTLLFFPDLGYWLLALSIMRLAVPLRPRLPHCRLHATRPCHPHPALLYLAAAL